MVLEVYLYCKYCVLKSNRFEFLVIEAWNKHNFAILKDVFAKNVNDVSQILRDIFRLHKKLFSNNKRKKVKFGVPFPLSSRQVFLFVFNATALSDS